MTDRARAHDRLGDDQVTLGEIGSERPADAGRDDQRRSRAGRARVEMGGARTGAEELKRATAKMRPGTRRDALETELTGQTTGLDLDGGNDEDAGHASLCGVGPESFSAWPAAFAAALARSHAA